MVYSYEAPVIGYKVSVCIHLVTCLKNQDLKNIEDNVFKLVAYSQSPSSEASGQFRRW